MVCSCFPCGFPDRLRFLNRLKVIYPVITFVHLHSVLLLMNFCFSLACLRRYSPYSTFTNDLHCFFTFIQFIHLIYFHLPLLTFAFAFNSPSFTSSSVSLTLNHLNVPSFSFFQLNSV